MPISSVPAIPADSRSMEKRLSCVQTPQSGKIPFSTPSSNAGLTAPTIPGKADFLAYAQWCYQMEFFSPRKARLAGLPAQPKTGVPYYMGYATLHAFSEDLSFGEQGMLCEFLAHSRHSPWP